MAKKPTYEELERKVKELEKIADECMWKEKAFQESHQEKEAILNSLSEHVVHQDTEMKIVWANRAACESVNLRYEELFERHCYEVWSQRSDPCPDCPVMKAMETGQPQEMEKTTPDGRCWFIRGYPLRDSDGKIEGGIEVTLDITDRKQAEEALRESKERFSAFMDYLPAIVFIKDEDHRTEYMNRYMRDVLGADDTWIGRTILEIFGDNDLARTMIADDKRALSAGFELKEESVSGADGRERLYETRKFGIERKGKSPLLGGIAIDITERKQAEEALRESEEKYRLLIESIPSVTWITDEYGKTTFISQNVEKIFGFSQEEIYYSDESVWFGRIHPDDADRVRECFELIFDKEEEFDFEYRIQRKDGEWIWVHDMAVMAFEKDNIRYAYGVFTDITDRKKADEALRESEEKYRRLTENAKDMIYRMSLPDGIYEYVSPASIDLLGYTPEEFYESPIVIQKTIHPAWMDYLQEQWANLVNGKVPPFYEYQVIHKSGDERWINQRNVLILDNNGQPQAIEGILTDVTDRKQAEEALRESEEKYRLLIENATDAVFIVQDEVLRFANPKAEEMTGYSADEFAKTPFVDFIYPEDRDMVLERHVKRLKGEEIPSIYSFRILNKSGEVSSVELNAVLINWEGRPATLSFLRDITAQERLEAQLQHAQRMEAIATLAGGVAHEFNNALMGIMGNIELLKMHLSEDEGIDKYFDTMKSSGHRMSRLTDQLLAYAQGGKYKPKYLKLDDFVIETLSILQHDLNPAVRVGTYFQKDVSYIKADYTQMQMVLSAILTNSNEAIEDVGFVKIIGGNEDIEEDFIRQRPGLKLGPYVCLTVEDDGKGMDEETRSRIFEPFFTTKFQGRGMGMAAAYGIVKNHDGWISVDSELGKGTTVQIYLPAVEIEVEKPKKAKVEVATGSGTILMIEDEEVVIEVTQAMLEMLGYRVMVAKTGKDAVHIAETFDGDIGLALLDIKLPDMEGGKVYPLIMEARPNLKVIVFSGYAIDGPAQSILDAGAQDFIQKPFSLATLSEKLKEILEGK